MSLRQGSRGSNVTQLQMVLRNMGLYTGALDGVYGPATARAVAGFQRSRGLLVDGIAGPQTLGALQGARRQEASPSHEPLVVREMHTCAPAVWSAWLRLVALLTTPAGGAVVRYGPGRGLWVDGQWMVTHGPGRLGSTRWRSKLGTTFPSFHCSSLTNFFLGWLLGRDHLYTHSGNIPSLHELCTKSGRELHQQRTGANGRPVAEPFRGYGESCARLAGAGGKLATLTWPQLLERRGELGTFNVFAQSTRRSDGRWKWWHHTGVVFVDHTHPDRPVRRLAADGYAGSGRVYSATPLDVEEVTADWAARTASRTLLQVFRVRPRPDGRFADGLPAPVQLEVA